MIHLLIQAKKGTLVYDGDTKETSEAGFATVQESAIGQKQIKRSVKYYTFWIFQFITGLFNNEKYL